MRPSTLLALAVTVLLPIRGAAQRSPASAVSQAWPADTSWRHIGPAAFGGRVDDIEAVASDPRVIFVGTAAGGVFRSRNAGTTWEAVLDGYANTLSVGDIAIAPSDARVVWAGMGEPNNRQSSTWGDGVYRSTDGGSTWRHMGLRETQSIGRIVIDPHDANVVFVAAVGHLFGPNEERGLYRTKDGGITWTKVLAVDANTGATDVVISPDGRTLIAATYQRRRREFGFAGSGPGSGLWRSTDGGDTWQRITAGMPGGDLGRIGLSLSASDSRVVYAVIEAFAPGGGVYRSTDAGVTWTRRSATNQRGNYFSQIRVDPRNPERIWLLTTALLLSNDGGTTFTTDSVAGYVHPDHHAMWIDPAQPDHVLLGNDGGVYATRDGGHTFAYLDNLPISQFYDIAIDDREPYWIFGGAQDNGSWAFPSATYSRGGMTNADVLNTGFGDGFQSAVDGRDRRYIYANSQNGRSFLADLTTREERFIQPVAAAGADPYRFNWNTAMHASPNDGRAVYLGAQKLLRTDDRGEHWDEISPDLTRHLPRNGISVGTGFPAGRSLSANDGVSAFGNITTISESPRAAGTIMVGTDDGNVQLTTDGGGHWTDLTPRFALSAPRYVSKVYASRHDARVAYVAFDGHWDDDVAPHLFKTVDGGTTWQPIVSGIPDWKPVTTIEEDPRNPDLLFAGTGFGLYCSFDGGGHWSPAPGNIPPVFIARVIADSRTHDLVVATHARGVMILDDITPLEARATSAQDITLHAARPAVEVQRFRDLPWPAGDAFVAPNAFVGTFISYTVADDPPATADSVRVTIAGRAGQVVGRFAGPDRRGTHRIAWDMRLQLAFVPPASDSGFYGPPRAPYVPPGDYVVTLAARGKRQTQPVQVRRDSRAVASDAAQRAKSDINRRAADIVKQYADAIVALDSIDAHLAAPASATDSVTKAAKAQASALRQRLRGNSIVSGLGRVFDLTAAIESSSMAPTRMQHRSIDASAAEFAELTRAVAALSVVVFTTNSHSP